VVTLTKSASLTAALIPPGVFIPEGKTSLTFFITTDPASSRQEGAITATLGADSLIRGLAILPIGVQRVFVVDPKSARSNRTVFVQVNLECAAGPEDIPVNVTISNGDVARFEDGATSSTVIVPKGAMGVSFPIKTGTVSKPTKATITATANGITKATTLTVKP
jgi:hypothetical protein